MAAPVGNQNAAKAKVWTAAIERALDKRGGRAEALDALAEKLLGQCDKADMGAIKELGDRLEGKPAQTLQGPDGTNLFQPVVDAARLLQTKLR